MIVQELKRCADDIVTTDINMLAIRNMINMRLNNKECALMDFLVKNQDRNISKDELKQRIWLEDDNGSENIVPMYITYLQEKLFALDANVKINDENGYSLEKTNNMYK